MITYYKQQTLQGGSVTGFRNEDNEPWIMYDTPPHSAVLKFKVGFGHYPLPEWKRRDINMMEQVERAIYASLKVEGFSHQDFDLLNTFQKTQVNKMARAAVKAMREPTDAMVAVGYDNFMWGPCGSTSDDLPDANPNDVWIDMIDAVLEEK